MMDKIGTEIAPSKETVDISETPTSDLNSHPLSEDEKAASPNEEKKKLLQQLRETIAHHEETAITDVSALQNAHYQLFGDSPYQEVKAVVDNTNDPELPINTLRAWILGITFAVLRTGIDQFFSLRQPGITISACLVQVLLYPIGVFMAKILPVKHVDIFGRRISLNPGPSNQKEHMLVTVMANVAYGDGVVGDGLTNGSAWDYFHINSVDKNNDGDYLVSARHTSCIYKVSGKNGSIIWQLGGSQSSFQLRGYNFSYQHDARFREENETMTILSFFDNASNNHTNTSSTSSGKIIAIDHNTNTSTLIRQYHAPGNGLLPVFQGNTQILPNKNVLIGWGMYPSISEHTEDGTAIFFATLASPDSQNYRAFKANWTAKPSNPPTLRTYSASANSPTTFWVSWNGATDIDRWRIHATSPESDEFTPLDVIHNQGFQTTYPSSSNHPRAFAEAIAANGSSLANSSVVDTSSSLPRTD
ncbi:hypothetical protein CNMCM5878_007172 [Aspergillus fumigatiaffinis]|nr:hypothetical protein CNMCM5878_007172 [Aspergillus fumigatiaffinis]